MPPIDGAVLYNFLAYTTVVTVVIIFSLSKTGNIKMQEMN